MNENIKENWRWYLCVVVILGGIAGWLLFSGNSDGQRIQRISDDIESSQTDIDGARDSIESSKERLNDAESTAQGVSDSVKHGADSVNDAQESASRIESGIDASRQSARASKQGIERCLEILETAKGRSGGNGAQD